MIESSSIAPSLPLCARQIDGNMERLAFLAQLPGESHGFTQDPARQMGNAGTLFGEGDERAGGDHAAQRLLPAQQRLGGMAGQTDRCRWWMHSMNCAIRVRGKGIPHPLRG
jgi:hypothetical protein